MKLLSSPKFIMLSLAFLGLVIVPITIIQIQNQQTTQQKAAEIVWLTDQSASTGCPDPGKGVIITVYFSNTEPDRSDTAMNVVATDQQTGKSVDMGTIRGGSSKTAQIATGRTTLNAGSVDFSLSWTDGHDGTDSRTATYKAVADCIAPSATPTVKPTAVPTPKLTNTPTPKPTAVPTPKPTATPTPTPKPGEPTPTVCPTLGPVQNVKITCPDCP